MKKLKSNTKFENLITANYDNLMYPLNIIFVGTSESRNMKTFIHLKVSHVTYNLLIVQSVCLKENHDCLRIHRPK